MKKKVMEAKDNRLNLLKNLITNVTYIKIRALENYWQARVFLLRSVEISYMMKYNLMICILIGVRLFTTTAIWMVSLGGILIFSEACTASSIAVVVKMLSKLEDANKKLTQVTRIYYEMLVYIDRLNQFFNCDEMDLDYIKSIEDYNGEVVTQQDEFLTNKKNIDPQTSISKKLDQKIQGEQGDQNNKYAIVMRNGDFHWNRPWEELEKKRKALKEEAKNKTKEDKKNESKARSSNKNKTRTEEEKLNEKREQLKNKYTGKMTKIVEGGSNILEESAGLLGGTKKDEKPDSVDKKTLGGISNVDPRVPNPDMIDADEFDKTNCEEEIEENFVKMLNDCEFPPE